MDGWKSRLVLDFHLVYGSFKVLDQVFWLLNQFAGFLVFGASLGHIYKRHEGYSGD